MIRPALAFAVLAVAACSSRSDSGGAVPWRTVFDSTGDTIIARTTGEVPNELVRRLVLEQKIGEAEGSDSVTFGQIWYVIPTDDGRIFVFDHQGPTIKLFDSTGKLQRFVGRKGSGPGEFGEVNGMDVLPNGRLALWDATNGRVSVYDGNGDFSRQWRVPVGGFFTSNALRADRAGNIVLNLTIARRAGEIGGESGYIRFDEQGTVHDTVRVPKWIDSTPQIAASRGNPPQISVSLPIPFAPQLVHLWSKAGVLVSGPSAPYVAYLTNGRGKPVKVLRDWTPVAVQSEEADEHRARATWQVRLSIPEWSWKGADVPATKPAYASIQGSEDGALWVSIYSEAVRVADVDSAAATPGLPPMPPQHYREPNVYDVFGANGIYLGRVRAEQGQEIMRMHASRVWGVLTDSLGVAYLARWRVEPSFISPK